MARIRTVKPQLFTSRTVSAWPVGIRWTFAGLFTYMDDYGRGLDEARLVKAEVYPLDDRMPARKVEEHLAFIAANGPLCRYSVDDSAFLHIVTWTEHQRVNRPTKSKIPPCPLHVEAVSAA
jgi:hypothetical protein